MAELVEDVKKLTKRVEKLEKENEKLILKVNEKSKKIEDLENEIVGLKSKNSSPVQPMAFSLLFSKKQQCRSSNYDKSEKRYKWK